MFSTVYSSSATLWTSLTIDPRQVFGDFLYQWVAVLIIVSGHYMLVRNLKHKNGKLEEAARILGNQKALLEQEKTRMQAENIELLRQVEELAYLGAKYLIGYGAAGSIDRNLPKGRQIVANPALTTDGTSRIYCPEAEEIPADPELLDMLSGLTAKLPYDIQQATVATVDAVYRETESLLSEWRDQGAQAINMETTAFYAASRVCGVKSLWVGFVSDLLIDEKWDDWYTYQDSAPSESVRICRELVESLRIS